MKLVNSLIITALLLTSCGSVPLTGRRQMLLVSDSEVLSASLSQYDEYIKTAPKSTDATKTAMVTRVGKKIAAATENYLKQNGLESEIANFQWEFNLIQSDELNAFCMPGGKIVVYEGLLPLVASDDELGTVLGHEVAHAVAKHSNERMSQELLAQYGASVLDAALSHKSAAVRDVGNTVFGLGTQLGVMLPYSRQHELEADYMGLVFMTMAGYDPNKAVSFWQKMSAASGNSETSDFMSTHPNDAKRIAAIQSYLPEMEKYKTK
ncbi:MAG: M48 family metallopeptidase [Tannerella sp.]|jgi:predicted Zn-dependent protease|nr:M48 family metallopeptidase [Tannerella sp.]